MAAKLPDGSIVQIFDGYAPPIEVFDVQNSDLPEASSDTQTFQSGDILIMQSGWSGLNNRVVIVTQSSATSFTFKGIDTTNAVEFPPGGGAGYAIKVSVPTTVNQIMTFTTNGGEQQYVTYAYLEQNFESQMPTVFSAQSIELEIADDIMLGGYQSIKFAADARATRVLGITMPDGQGIYYHGFVSLQENPTIAKGEVMKVKAVLSLISRFTRFP